MFSLALDAVRQPNVPQVFLPQGTFHETNVDCLMAHRAPVVQPGPLWDPPEDRFKMRMLGLYQLGLMLEQE